MHMNLFRGIDLIRNLFLTFDLHQVMGDRIDLGITQNLSRREDVSFRALGLIINRVLKRRHIGSPICLAANLLIVSLQSLRCQEKIRTRAGSRFSAEIRRPIVSERRSDSRQKWPRERETLSLYFQVRESDSPGYQLRS
jgi:hypothetical protein